jgi:hypothetical protein
MKKYRIVNYDEKWWKAEEKHWFYGWQFVSLTVAYSLEECLKKLQFATKAYDVKVSSYAVEIIK